MRAREQILCDDDASQTQSDAPLTVMKIDFYPPGFLRVSANLSSADIRALGSGLRVEDRASAISEAEAMFVKDQKGKRRVWLQDWKDALRRVRDTGSCHIDLICDYLAPTVTIAT